MTDYFAAESIPLSEPTIHNTPPLAPTPLSAAAPSAPTAATLTSASIEAATQQQQQQSSLQSGVPGLDVHCVLPFCHPQYDNRGVNVLCCWGCGCGCGCDVLCCAVLCCVLLCCAVLCRCFAVLISFYCMCVLLCGGFCGFVFVCVCVLW